MSIQSFYDNRNTIYNYSMTPGSLYDKIYQIIGRDKNVLDIGCANGNFSREIKKNNNIVYGIEVSPVMAKHAEKYLDKVIIGNIENMRIPFKKNSFDVILCMDILEHLFEPMKVIENLKPFLKKNGSIIVSLPNVANWEVRVDLLRGRFDSEKTAILEEGHLRFFTYKTAVKMFENAGYSVKHFDVVMNLPLPILKIHNRFPFLRVKSFLGKHYYRFFGYQFIFELGTK